MGTAFSRRRFLAAAARTTAGVAMGGAVGCAGRRPAAPAIVVANRPGILSGVGSGDVTAESAMIWSKTDRAARMVVEWATTESFAEPHRVLGPDALPTTDFAAKLDLRGLPPNQRIFYRVRFADLSSPTVESEPVVGTFRTAPRAAHDVRFAWSADTVGQGWGIDPAFGGMRIYRTIREMAPDFFLHSGDTIYADDPLPKEVRLDDGRIWRNIVTPAKSKVAETLDEFRGCHAYNLLDEHLRQFNASIPVIAQWDDHEVRNNWYPDQVIDDPRYKVRDVNLLARRAKQAFFEYMPIRVEPAEPGRIYRSFSFGPMLDVFVLDERSYRGKNNPNRQTAMSAESAFLGAEQLGWLKARLKASTALWKVIASDMPIGLVVSDGKNSEAAANGDDGPPLGRELEIAELLRFCKSNAIRNLVWLTADTHYATDLYYDPERASFKEFDPFWEFVSGPLHAGTFGPNRRDNTFGPQMKFQATAPKGGMGPAAGFQFFGMVAIDARSGVMSVSQHNAAGQRLHVVDLQPVVQ